LQQLFQVLIFKEATMKKLITFVMTIALLLSVVSFASAKPQSDTTVMSVIEDQSVTIRLEEFPDDETFLVYMGFRDTLGLNGYLVSKLETNDGGTFLAKFLIPEELKGEDVISIRFESQDSAKFWYNFFYNETGSSQGTSSGTTYNNLGKGVPTILLVKMVQGQYMEVTTKYFPEGERWAIFVNSGSGAKSNKGWIEVKGFNSEEGGVYNITIPIPSSLQYAENIAVKFYSVDDSQWWYNLFDNQNYP
jgi:hypothetical protein